MTTSVESQNGNSIASTPKVSETSPNFTRIPVLSLAKARDPSTRPDFLAELLNALLNVGFLYLADTGVSKDLVDRVCAETRLFFNESALPFAEKEKIEMKNEKSFLGWSRVSFTSNLISLDFILHEKLGFDIKD